MEGREQFTWLNEPKVHWQGMDRIEMAVDPKTDFWRKTHYGFIRDSGHFYFQEVKGEFVMSVMIEGEYRSLYDQAGLMVRQDERNWMKAGIEFVHNRENISAVVTHEHSDWSMAPYESDGKPVWLRVTRRSDFLEVSYSTNGVDYDLIRLAYFEPGVPVQAGLMAAAPQGAGFLATFRHFSLQGS